MAQRCCGLKTKLRWRGFAWLTYAFVEHAAQGAFPTEPIVFVAHEKDVGNRPTAFSMMQHQFVHPGIASIWIGKVDRQDQPADGGAGGTRWRRWPHSREYWT